GHGAADAFKNLDPEMRKKAEQEMAVERMIGASGRGDDKFDVKTITDELEHLADPAQRAAVLKEDELRTGNTLQATIHSECGEGNYYRTATDQLLSDDRTKAEEKLADLAKKDPEKYKEKRKRAEELARTLGGELGKSDPSKRKIFDTLGFTDG